MQVNERIDREPIKLCFIAALSQYAPIGCIAEILEQHEPSLLVGGEHLRRAEPIFPQHVGDGEKRPHIVVRWWRIHQDRALAIESEAIIMAKRGIAGQGRARRLAPSGGGKKTGENGGALVHGSPAEASRSCQSPVAETVARRCIGPSISRPTLRASSGTEGPRRSGHSTRTMPSARASSKPSSMASSGRCTR